MDKVRSFDASTAMMQAQAFSGEKTIGRAKLLASKEIRDEKQLNKASSGFEALLLQQMLKSMWETVQTTGLLGENSNEAQIYRDMFNQAVSDNISEGKGVGIKKFLAKELGKLEQK